MVTSAPHPGSGTIAAATATTHRQRPSDQGPDPKQGPLPLQRQCPHPHCQGPSGPLTMLNRKAWAQSPSALECPPLASVQVL